jgi:hypothetical protein
MRLNPDKHYYDCLLVEHSTVNRMVAGSSPARGANNFNQLVAVVGLVWQV